MKEGLLRYDARTLMALKEAIEGSDEYFRWLVERGYPELGAFSNFLQDDAEAERFLVRTGNGWLGLVSHAIDGDRRARLWVQTQLAEANMMFVLACRREERARGWLRFMKLDILLLVAGAVADLRNKQELDRAFPYKMKK